MAEVEAQLETDLTVAMAVFMVLEAVVVAAREPRDRPAPKELL